MMNKIYLNVVFNSDMLNLAFKDELYHDHWLFICFVLIVSSIWQNLSVERSNRPSPTPNSYSHCYWEEIGKYLSIFTYAFLVIRSIFSFSLKNLQKTYSIVSSVYVNCISKTLRKIIIMALVWKKGMSHFVCFSYKQHVNVGLIFLFWL